MALESLQCDRISTARTTFEQLLQQHPADAAYQIGMANACAMQFEATRTDPAPDATALRLAESHARHACLLDPNLAEACATLGFVLERTGRRADALAALERAVALEPDNWRHQVRLALGSWGETRPATRTARWRRSIRNWRWKRAGTEPVDVAIARAATATGRGRVRVARPRARARSLRGHRACSTGGS